MNNPNAQGDSNCVTREDGICVATGPCMHGPAQDVSDQALGAVSLDRINCLIDAIENELLQWAVYGGHVEVNVMFFTKQLRAVINGGPK